MRSQASQFVTSASDLVLSGETFHCRDYSSALYDDDVIKTQHIAQQQLS